MKNNGNNTNTDNNYKLLYYPVQLKLYIIDRINESSEFSVDNHLDKFLFIMNMFYSKNHIKDYYEDGIPINILKLRKVISDNRAERFIKALIEWNIIYKTKNYSKGNSSSKYEILSPYDTLPYNRNKHYRKGL